MQTDQWKFFQLHNVVRFKVVRFVVRTSVIAMFGVSLMGTGPDMHLAKADVLRASTCSYQNRLDSVARGAKHNGIAARALINVAHHAISRHLALSNLFSVDQNNCFSGHYPGSRVVRGHGPAYHTSAARRLQAFYRRSRTHHPLAFSHTPAMVWHIQSARNAAVGTYNTFPYGACTWWANQRYYQLHGVFVPWGNNANAWQWAERAQEYGWHVSLTPQVGAIIDLQPGTQGAYGLGHVAVVERVLDNGHVIASSMSWGGNPWAVTHFQFAPGPGVTFLSA
ncbi:MAG TPA: CHAP domain-containing protein [Ktedonosporobacter sp.]|nr:CHAP domain-containing protein [Ktedonosporobacter sp.]